jgi:hypothetical protein
MKLGKVDGLSAAFDLELLSYLMLCILPGLVIGKYLGGQSRKYKRLISHRHNKLAL